MTDTKDRRAAAADRPMYWGPSLAFLKWAVVAILAGCAVFLIGVLVFVPDQPARAAGPAWLSLVATIAWVLLARGRIRAAVSVLGIGVWIAVTGTALFFGGLHSTGIVLYPLVIIMIGWLVGGREAVAIALLTAATTLGIALAEARGVLPLRALAPPMLYWVVQCGAMVFSVLMILFLARSYRHRLDEAERLGRDLARHGAQLRAREAELSRAQAVARVGSWAYDIGSDAMEVSAETCRIFGLPGTRGSRESYLAKVHAEDRAALDAAWQTALKGGEAFDSEHRILVGKDVRWVRQRAELTFGADGTAQGCVGTTQDVTESKHYQAQMLATQNQLNATLNAIPDLLFELGLDGRFYACHARSGDPLMASAVDFPGKQVCDVMPPEAAAVVMAALREAHASGASHGRQYALDNPHGRCWFELSVSRKPVGSGEEPRFIALVRDITERMRQAGEYQSIIQASTDGFWVTDSAGRILDVNDSICRMLGYTREELLQLSIREIEADESSEELAAHTRSLMEAGAAVFAARHRRKDGTIIDVEVSVQFLAVLGSRFFAFVRDITERKRAEAERALLEAQLRESQKMEALGTLAGGVAHDFNNIIATVMGNVELALQDVAQGHPAHESLEEIRKASQRAKSLVRQILAFGRRQLLERKEIALALVAEESARLLRSTLPAGVRLTVNCAPDTPPVLADPTQIQQVLLNLCTNAWQAMHGQERAAAIEIGLSLHLASATPYGGPERRSGSGRAALRPGRYACLTVRDSGPGMDQATRSRIFEPFFTTKPLGTGTGLGLAVVHGIVQEHGASIAVQTAPGEGATFRIYFPASEHAQGVAQEAQPQRAVVSESGATPMLHGEGKSILYVDDDEAIVFLMMRLLQRQGYRVSGYTDAHKALQAVHAQPDAFDLAVTDYNMPGMSGLELARALRQIRADLPVALASGYITEELSAEAPAAGVSELVYKPNTIDELCAAVARLAQKLRA